MTSQELAKKMEDTINGQIDGSISLTFDPRLDASDPVQFTIFSEVQSDIGAANEYIAATDLATLMDSYEMQIQGTTEYFAWYEL